MTILQLRQRLSQEQGKLQSVQQGIAQANANLATLREQALDIEEAGLILQHVAQQTQSQVGVRIENLVTMAMEAVFPGDSDYQFKADFVQRRDQTEVDLMLADTQGNRIRPSDQDGGGLVDVVAFVLRVALWSLGKDTRPVIILDEPWRNLHSREYHGRVAELVKTMSERLGLQFIIITGEDEGHELLAGADRVIRVGKVRGVSEVKSEKRQ